MKRNTVIFAAVAVIFTVVGISAGWKNIAPETPQAQAAANLRHLTLPDVRGQSQPLAQWQGKALLVNFWATWCAPCVEEMPELSALQTEMTGKNIQIIGLGIDTAANMATFATKHQITYPLYVAGMQGTDLSRQFGNQAGGLPFTVLIDRQGKVRKTYLGRLSMQEVRTDLLAL